MARAERQGTEPQEVRFAARDGAPLVGTFFPAEVEARSAALIGPATGIPAGYYRRFAEYLAGQGIPAFTFDYRGIGASLVGHVRDSAATKRDWGQLDLPAALDEVVRLAPGRRPVLVGHSAGGQLVALMDNAAQLERVVQIAGSSGYLGGLGGSLRWLGPFLLKVYGPLSIRLFGYAALRRIGWGQDLPAGVGLDWRDWCSSPGYFESSFGREIERHFLDDVTCPVLNLSASDDKIATERNVQDLVRLFARADWTVERIDVRTAGVGAIGHAGWFRSRCAPLWPRVVDFLEG